jgi:DNA-binding HxlR family transcriptional regulator
MNEELTDEYCNKIFITLVIIGEKTRFNELHRQLKRFKAKMSKPTLIQHLNHLIENDIIKRDTQDKQNVTYELNYDKLEQLQESEKRYARIIKITKKSEETFKSQKINDQVYAITAILTLESMLYLKLQLLDQMNPEKKLANSYTYTTISRRFRIYMNWLLDSCKDSKEKTQTALRNLEQASDVIRKDLFK